MRPLVRLLISLVVVLGLIAAGAAGWFFGFRNRPNEKRRVDSAPVVQAVRNVAKLATVEVEIADVIRYEEVRTILLFDIPKNATLGLAGLEDKQGRGRTSTLDVEKKARVLTEATRPPKGQTRWTVRGMARHAGVSVGAVHGLWRANDLFTWMAAGKLEVRIDQSFPLSEAAAAHTYLEGRNTKGKVLLIP